MKKNDNLIAMVLILIGSGLLSAMAILVNYYLTL
jgi:hypothetical protein